MTLKEQFTGNYSGVSPGLISFAEVVEQACEKLKDRQIKYSIRRIQAMEDQAAIIEKELDEFLKDRDNNENN